MQRLGAHGFVSGYADGLVNVTRWTGTLDTSPSGPLHDSQARSAWTPAFAFGDHGAVTTACVPSYFTTWSGEVVTPMPAPWFAPTNTTLKVRVVGIPV